VSLIIGINVIVFLAWQSASMVPGLFEFMTANFLVSTSHILHWHAWTLVTAAFSHNELWHLAINMFVLWSFGTVLERLWGTRVFFLSYLAAAVVASISHCAVSSSKMRRLRPSIQARTWIVTVLAREGGPGALRFPTTTA